MSRQAARPVRDHARLSGAVRLGRVAAERGTRHRRGLGRWVAGGARAGALLVALLGRLVATVAAWISSCSPSTRWSRRWCWVRPTGGAGRARAGERLRGSDGWAVVREVSGGAAAAAGDVGAGPARAVARAGVLRGDGSPLRELPDWLPGLPAPAHPQPWAAMVLTGRCSAWCSRLGRAGGEPAGFVAGRAAPARPCTAAPARSARRGRPSTLGRTWGAGRGRGPAGGGGAGVAVRAGRRSRASPAVELAGRGGFHDPGCEAVFTGLTVLHQAGLPVDLITLAAAAPPSRPPAAAGDTGRCRRRRGGALAGVGC